MKAVKPFTCILLCGGISVASFATWKSNAVEHLLDNSSGAIPACEETLLKNLKSPSSYRRIKAIYLPGPPLTKNEYRQYELTKGCASFDFGTQACIEANVYFEKGVNAASLSDKNSKGDIDKPVKSRWEDMYDIYNRMHGQEGTAVVVIQYDAKNSFGSAIRDKYMCSFGAKNGDRFSTSNIYLPDSDLSRYGKI